MKDYIESPELQEMKQQIGLLKDKLNKQTIINETLLRNVMKRNVSSINSHGRITVLLSLLFAPFCAMILTRYGFTLWFGAATVALLLFSALKTYIHHRELWRMDLVNDDMLTIGKAVSRLKNQYVTWLRIAIPILLFWFSWLIAECLLHMEAFSGIKFFLPGAIAGAIIGFFLGNKKRKKIIRQAEEVLIQIEELK